jgi:hypothetical protein
LRGLARPLRQQAVARHRVEDARLAVLEHQQHRRHREHRAERDEPARALHPRALERVRERIGVQARIELRVLHHAGEHRADDHVDDVQIASPPRMPIGRLRCGFFVSSAAVEMASKPMYAKKTMAAP